MWFRDYALVELRIQDLAREAEKSALVARLADPGHRASRGHGRLRVAGATGIRRIGRAVIGLSDWIDDGASADEAGRPVRGVAYR
jgi:hypothetical protein